MPLLESFSATDVVLFWVFILAREYIWINSKYTQSVAIVMKVYCVLKLFRWLWCCVEKRKKDIYQVLLQQNAKSLLGLVFSCYLLKREKITTQPLHLKTKTQTGPSGGWLRPDKEPKWGSWTPASLLSINSLPTASLEQSPPTLPANQWNWSAPSGKVGGQRVSPSVSLGAQAHQGK